MAWPSNTLHRNRRTHPGNQRISPGQIRILQTLWNTRARRSSRVRTERTRQARLEYISTVVGREIESSKELSWREANQAIRRLLAETAVNRFPAPETLAVPERAGEGAEAAVAPAPVDAPSEEQLWKIRQIAQYLGWSQPGQPAARLSGFLRVKFHVETPEQLTQDQAWRAIEALCAAGARERVKTRKGKSCRVVQEELTREVAALKHELQQWRPA